MNPPIHRVILLYLKSFIGFSKEKAIIALGLILFKGFTQGVGILMLIPLLHVSGLINNPETKGGFSNKIVDFMSYFGFSINLLSLLCIYIFLVGAYSFINYYQSILNVRLNREYTQHVRIRLYHAISHTNWLFFLRSKNSDFFNVLTHEIQKIAAGTHFFLNLTASSIIVLTYMTIAFWMSPFLAGLTFISATILMVLLRPLNKRVYKLGVNLRLNSEQMVQSISEHLNGMKESKFFSLEEQHIERYRRFSQKALNEILGFQVTRSRILMANEIGAVLFLSVILLIAVEMVNAPIADVLVLIYLFSRILPRVSTLHQDYQQILNMLPSFCHVRQLQFECENAREKLHEVHDSDFILNNAVRFEGVFFQYSNNGFHLNNVSFELPHNKISVIMGPSGAGKSTIADLLMGLLSPTEGAIYLGNEELTMDNVRGWRKHISYVPQETFLFNDSIRQNLLLVKPEASETELWYSLKKAAADDFVKELPQAMDTIIGERGRSLSGGERQRIALARALLRQPQLIILDEATSSLDRENEKKILDVAKQIKKQCTVVVITHRKSTLDIADHILCIEKGQITKSCNREDIETC